MNPPAGMGLFEFLLINWLSPHLPGVPWQLILANFGRITEIIKGVSNILDDPIVGRAEQEVIVSKVKDLLGVD